MNILYGIQGTGHGHISRAKELLPELGKYCGLDVLVSGYNCQLSLECPVTYRKHGLSLSYDSKGGISVLETLRGIKPARFITDVQSIPLDKYDLIINDYEPVTAWAARAAGIPCIGLSHQAAFLSDHSPRPEKRSLVAEAILQHFAPVGHAIAFHFRRYDTFIEPPIIRSEIHNLNPTSSNHITVYLPAFHHQLLVKMFRKFTRTDWHIFSPSCRHYSKEENVTIHPVCSRIFLESFEHCEGIITSAGFETSAEAMYMGKKLLTIPIKNQYEQHCNAAALKQMGVTVIPSIKGAEITLWDWLASGPKIRLKEIADPIQLVQQIVKQDSGSHFSASHLVGLNMHL